MGQDLRNLNMHLPDGEVLINGKKYNLPVTKEYIFNVSNIFSGIRTLLGDEYHINLRKYHETVQHPPV